METFARLAATAACLLVLLACICRIDLLRRGRSRSSWFLVYLLFAVYAFGRLLALVAGDQVDWYAVAGVFGLVLFMVLTRKQWRDGPPPETDAAELRRADGSELP